MVVLTVGPFGFSLRMDMGFLINEVDLEATTISIYLSTWRLVTASSSHECQNGLE